MSKVIRHYEMVSKYDQVIRDNTGLPARAFFAMLSLFEQDGQKPSRLAAKANSKPTSFTPVLDALQNLGWVTREPDAKDRRAVRVTLTEIGEAQRSKFQQTLAKLEGLQVGEVA